MLTILLLNLLILFGVVTLLWLLSVILRDASIVDPFWGTGFVILAWLTWAQLKEATSPRDWVLLGMVTLWGVRLSLYLLWRNVGKEEDRRYQAMRARAGASFWLKSLWRVFYLQAALLWIIAMPVQVGLQSTPLLPFISVVDIAGLLLFTIGIMFEAVGDAQLARFKSDPASRGKVMDRGLWRYTRHPNYFGDFCVWWGLYLVGAAGGAWWTVFAPAIMAFFLLRVSGVTLLEKDIAERRPEYLAYQRRTSTFFPWPPKSG